MRFRTRWLSALVLTPAVGVALWAQQAPVPADGRQEPQVTVR